VPHPINRGKGTAMSNKVFYRVLAALFCMSLVIAQAGVMITGATV
jgi:hypothetical protein